MRAITLTLVAWIGGCAAHGPSFVDLEERLAQVPDGTARIVFFRTKDSTVYMARSAIISVDGESIGSTAYGGFHYYDVPQGSYRLRANMWDAPGQCELTLTAAAGQTYYFQVDPRDASFEAFAAGDFVAELVTGGVLAGLAGGLVGSAAESYGRECGGAFKLYPVNPALARSKLLGLNLSE